MSEQVRAVPTSVQLKFVVAATGAMLAGFVLFHMLGNLQVYLGQDAMNDYAAFLKSMPGPLWAARLGLLGAFVAHIWGIWTLEHRSAAARPVGYAVKRAIGSTLFSRTMRPTGVIVLAFVLYHLAHLTAGLTHPEHYRLIDGMGRHDVYSMLVLGLQQPLVALSYIAAMGVLGMHLAHGTASVFQTAGFRGGQWRSLFDATGRVFALAVVAGNISIPLACMLGWVEPAQGVL